MVAMSATERIVILRVTVRRVTTSHSGMQLDVVVKCVIIVKRDTTLVDKLRVSV